MLKTFTKREKKNIEGFKNGVFPVYYGNRDEFSEDEDEKDEKDEENEEDEEEQEEQKPIKYDYKTLIKQITDEEKDINKKLFKKYFKAQMPSDMLMFLNRANDTEMKNQLVKLINSGLKDLKEEINKMSEQERKIEKPDKIVEIVEKILKFNEQNQQEGKV